MQHLCMSAPERMIARESGLYHIVSNFGEITHNVGSLDVDLKDMVATTDVLKESRVVENGHCVLVIEEDPAQRNQRKNFCLVQK